MSRRYRARISSRPCQHGGCIGRMTESMPMIVRGARRPGVVQRRRLEESLSRSSADKEWGGQQYGEA